MRKFIYRNYGKRDTFKVYERFGLRLILNYSNRIDRYLIIKEPYEPDQLDYFVNKMENEKFDLFLDVGANIGLYTLIAANIGNVKKIIAFEPDTRNNYQLKANILLNDIIKNIDVYDYGLSNKNAEVNFLKETGRNTGQSRIEETAPVGTKLERYERTHVRVCKFDDQFRYSNCKAFVKMDIEGHELHAVKGMKNLLTRNKCILQVEVFEGNIASFGDYLNKIGYQKKLQFGEDKIFSNYQSDVTMV